MGGGVGPMLVVAAVLLIPGRVQGRFYRDLFQGRRLLDAGYHREAVAYLERFIALVRVQPWRKRLLWLSWSVYTPDAEAMALNNLGAAKLALGQQSASEQAFKEALTLDPLYPVPHFNIAVLHQIRGNRPLAEQAAAEAARLGFARSTIDAVIYHAQSILARVEGRGVPAS